MMQKPFADIEDNEPVYHRLCKLIASGETVAFVGAGASAGLYPTWRGLIRELAAKTRASRADREFWIRIAGRRPQQAIRGIRETLGEKKYQAALRRMLSPAGKQPAYTPTHAALAVLNFRDYVTTNYDVGLPKACKAVVPATGVDVGAWTEADFLADWLSDRRPANGTKLRRVLFAHGRFDHPADIVLSAEDYRRAYAQGPYRRVFDHLWTKATLVFVGFGFSDAWFDYLADEVITRSAAQAGTARHIAIIGLREDEGYSSELRGMFRDQYNTDALFYWVKLRHEPGSDESFEDHSGLWEVLTALAAAGERRVAGTETDPLFALYHRAGTSAYRWLAPVDDDRDKFVRPFVLAENRFLQVLLTQFALWNNGDKGVRLAVDFDHRTPTIWTRHAKYRVKNSIPGFQDRFDGIQKEIDRRLLAQQDLPFHFGGPAHAGFMFRYASGGILPIVSLQGKEYYCLSYREIDPIGWNIANGGCDSLEELLNPWLAAKRELCEELIVVAGKERYVFVRGDHAEPTGREVYVDRPEHALARKAWDATFERNKANLRISNLRPHFLDIERCLVDATDGLVVRFGEKTYPMLPGVVVTVTAKDFGIEIDRIAKIPLPAGAIFLDGEVNEGRLLDRPVGLFAVERMEDQLSGRRFLPDIWFWTGQKRTAATEPFGKKAAAQFLKRLEEEGIRDAAEIRFYTECEAKYDLCPVTRQLIQRVIKMGGARSLRSST